MERFLLLLHNQATNLHLWVVLNVKVPKFGLSYYCVNTLLKINK